MKTVFYQKPDSGYDDVKGVRYHFPRQYLSRVENALDDLVVYYGPLTGKKGPHYSGVAEVRGIRKDPNAADHFYADLANYIDFDTDVYYRQDGGFERSLVLPSGAVSGGRAVQAVRNISDAEFAAIVQAGLSAPEEWPDRDESDPADGTIESGLDENPQAAFERPTTTQIMNRKWRDRKFRRNVLTAYDRTCAFTGLRLINGMGRPEVEAAHIRPVEKGGNDSVRNGIALSATVHWMFDRGLLSIGDDFSILRSRHLNHDVSHILRVDMKAEVPSDHRFQPHPEYLHWHRRCIFKQ
ncbi:HNH endonuclease [Oricola sp.]|uniref:HNH endonuclease n=1 Tax=Oricola sp. TaxID=1979950 RepID=UPI003BA8D4CA